MNSALRNLGFAALAALALASSASALSITPATMPQWTGPETSQNAIDDVIFGIMAPGTLELYKQNVGEVTESGDFWDSYTTTFDNEPDDPADATIEWDGGDIVGPTAYLLVKDGAGPPGWYLFNLTGLGWDGMEDLVLTGFWPNQGAISHVTLYGTKGGTNVPDGGTTAALLGLGLVAMSMIARRRAA